MNTGNRLMRQLATSVIRFRWMILLLTLLVTVFFGYRITQLKINADFATYLQQGSELMQQYEEVGEKFGGKSTSFLLIQTEAGIDADILAILDKLTRKIEASDQVSYVTSLTNVIDFRSTDYGLEITDLVSKQPDEMTSTEVEQMLQYTLSKKQYRGTLLSDDKQAANIVIRLRPGTDEHQFSEWLEEMSREVIAGHPDLTQTVQAYSGGMPSLMYSMTTLITNNLTTLVPVIVLLMIFILYLGFSRAGGVIVPLLDVLISTIWALGTVQLLGYDLNLLVGIMPVILLAMGSADGIHLMKGYYEERYQGKPPKGSIIDAIGELGMPILITTLTTSIGFLSLTISSFDVIRQFGIATAVAIVVAFIVTLVVIPGIISFAPVKRLEEPSGLKGLRFDLFATLGGSITRHPGKILTITAILFLGASVLIPRIQKDVDWTLCLAKGSDPYHAEMLLREKFGGSLPVQVFYEGDIRVPQTLQQMFLAENYLESLDMLNQPMSIAGIIAEMNYVMTGKYMIPETRQGISNLWLLLEGEDLLNQMVADQEKSALMQGKMASMHTRDLVKAVDQINSYLVQTHGFSADKTTQILNLVQWNAQEYGIKIDTTKIRYLIQNYHPAKQKLAAIIDSTVRAYLLSPSSEVVVTSRQRARQISTGLSEIALNKQNITAQQIESYLTDGAFGLTADDAYFTALSLETLIRDVQGEMRNGEILDYLQSTLPDTVMAQPGFVKEVTGALWMLNHPVVSEHQSPVNLTAVQTGLPPILKQMEEELTPTQVESVLLALGFIVVLFALIFHSWKVGLLGVIPLVVTIVFNFGLMALLGIGLDAFTAMIASITIGLGVDYAVHFTSRFSREFSRQDTIDIALSETLRTSGKAILINALAVGLGFAVLLFAGGQHIRRFGGLTSFTMITAAVLTLVVLPAIYLMFKPRFMEQPGENTPTDHVPADIDDVSETQVSQQI